MFDSSLYIYIREVWGSNLELEKYYLITCKKNRSLLRWLVAGRSWFIQTVSQVKVKVKVKCTLVLALRLCTGRTAHRGSRGIALLFLDQGIRRMWGVSVTQRPLFSFGKDPVPIVQEAGWAPGPVWTSAEKLVLTGIRSPGPPIP